MSTLKFSSLVELQTQTTALRAKLEKAFSPDTAVGDFRGNSPSAGQCAATAAIVFDNFGGSLVSTIIENESHWFNRIPVGTTVFDVDLTGDQFGRPSIQINQEGALYESARVRGLSELKDETIHRAIKLAHRAGVRISLLKEKV